MKLKLYLRIAKDKTGKIIARAGTAPNYAEIIEDAGFNPMAQPKALPTVRRTVTLDIPDDELAGEIKEAKLED